MSHISKLRAIHSEMNGDIDTVNEMVQNMRESGCPGTFEELMIFALEEDMDSLRRIEDDLWNLHHAA